MRLAVIGDAEHKVDELIKYGSAVGFDMVHAKEGLTQDIASTIHAVIFVAKDSLAAAHDKLDIIISKMLKQGVKRLVIHAPDETGYSINTPNIDWTIISDVSSPREKMLRRPLDQDFAEFIIGQVTDAQNVNSYIKRPAFEEN